MEKQLFKHTKFLASNFIKNMWPKGLGSGRFLMNWRFDEKRNEKERKKRKQKVKPLRARSFFEYLSIRNHYLIPITIIIINVIFLCFLLLSIALWPAVLHKEIKEKKYSLEYYISYVFFLVQFYRIDKMIPGLTRNHELAEWKWLSLGLKNLQAT